jgi:hypothetical protein
LNTISLAFNADLTDISALAQCKSLRHLDLHGCTQVCNISALSACTNLQTLVLTSSKVSDVTALGKISSLEALMLVGSVALHDVSALMHCTRLKALDVRLCKLLKGIPVWSMEWAAMDVSLCERSNHRTWLDNATPLDSHIMAPMFNMLPFWTGTFDSWKMTK